MKDKISKLVLFAIVFGLIFLFIKGHLRSKEIQENKKQTVCKFVFCKTFPKTTVSFFKYNVNNKWYRNSCDRCPENYSEKINKFFIIDYSSKDPDNIRVDFSNQITDTTAILKAGFTREDIGS
ncbi:hypothetical protein [Flavobacterium sp. YO64]|uniref:hypothetical protein n=1 Tax=Flavobacterium sp. YO64 TaxID=394559 RepID=UPI00100A6D06|nr:hypothetical protein [Flavobacterium sp. YO64]RXM43292.1 hypothetical protein BOW57_12935 [Flavobacterium sp. YO64]